MEPLHKDWTHPAPPQDPPKRKGGPLLREALLSIRCEALVARTQVKTAAHPPSTAARVSPTPHPTLIPPRRTGRRRSSSLPPLPKSRGGAIGILPPVTKQIVSPQRSTTIPLPTAAAPMPLTLEPRPGTTLPRAVPQPHRVPAPPTAPITRSPRSIPDPPKIVVTPAAAGGGIAAVKTKRRESHGLPPEMQNFLRRQRREAVLSLFQ
eukprot:Hpha_TRINITY_DN16331_c2_g8::TRINITY_DN16331_c2_g8_i1::g.60741::m.60741